MSVLIRRLTEADLPAAMALKEAAGWNQTEQDWRLLLRLEPEGCFALETEGRVAASATAYCYGRDLAGRDLPGRDFACRDLAWIGMVLTLPEFRGRGFGSRVFQATVDFCCQHGIRSIKLDATDMGKPLYERAGFVSEYEVERWGGVAPISAPSRSRLGSLTPALIEALAEGDAAAFGTNRAPLLEALCEVADWTACVSRVSYAMSRPGTKAHYFGPCVADGVEEARTLLQAFFAHHAGSPVFVDVPAPNQAARELLRDCGFEVRRTLLRMYLGENHCPGEPARVFGLAGFEYG